MNKRDRKGRFLEGHTFTVKWTEKEVIKKLRQVLKKIKENEGIYTLLDAADENDLYIDWFRYVQEKYLNNVQIYELIEKLYTKLERRSYNRAAAGEVNPYLGLFTLKAYHNRVEKQYVQTENKNETTFDGDINVVLKYPNKDKEE